MKKIPQILIEERLPKYLRALLRLQEDGSVEKVRSDDLARVLNYSPPQVRKDFNYFGKFGKRGNGYDIKKLSERLRILLGLDREWNMALVGVGGLGRGILAYSRFATQGFKIVAAFDRDPAKIGKRVANIPIRDVKDLADVVKKEDIHIGIVAVPASEARGVIERLEESGIRAILNYAPISPQKGRARIMEIDPVLKLQSLTYFLKQGEPTDEGADGVHALPEEESRAVAEMPKINYTCKCKS